jgi:prophage regulatory protein
MSNESHKPISILRRRDVESLLGLSRSAIYDKLNARSPRYDKAFPRPIKLGKSSIGWVASELNDWLAGRMAMGREPKN